mgnify:CR=1 FL=1
MLKHPKTLELLTINFTKAVKTLQHISNIILEYKTTQHKPELKKTLRKRGGDTIQSLAYDLIYALEGSSCSEIQFICLHAFRRHF